MTAAEHTLVRQANSLEALDLWRDPMGAWDVKPPPTTEARRQAHAQHVTEEGS